MSVAVTAPLSFSSDSVLTYPCHYPAIPMTAITGSITGSKGKGND